MSDFNELALEDRLGADSLAGRPAEDAFIRWMNSKDRVLGVHFVHNGFDRVSTEKGLVASLDPVQRHAPDFIQMGGHAWEVQGAAGPVWKVKQEKVNALTKYELGLSGGRQVRWFLYDQSTDEAMVCSHGCLLAVVRTLPLDPDLLEGKAGWLVPASAFTLHLVYGDPFQAERIQRQVQGL